MQFSVDPNDKSLQKVIDSKMQSGTIIHPGSGLESKRQRSQAEVIHGNVMNDELTYYEYTIRG